MSTLLAPVFVDFTAACKAEIEALLPEEKLFFGTDNDSMTLRVGYPSGSVITIVFSIRFRGNGAKSTFIHEGWVYGQARLDIHMIVPSGHGATLQQLDDMLQVARKLSAYLLALDMHDKNVSFKFEPVEQSKANAAQFAFEQAVDRMFHRTSGLRKGKTATFGLIEPLSGNPSPIERTRKKAVYTAALSDGKITFTRTK